MTQAAPQQQTNSTLLEAVAALVKSVPVLGTPLQNLVVTLDDVLGVTVDNV